MTTDTQILNRLGELGALPDGGLPIAEAALWLAHRDMPDASLTPYLEHVRVIADHVTSAVRETRHLRDRVAALRDVIFGFHGYTGDAETYDDMQNANLIRVIDRRKGLPVALGILVLHAAKAQGWDASGLNFPGHFLLRLGMAGETVVVDPFTGLRRLGADELGSILSRVHGKSTRLRPEFIRSVSDRDVLVRLQNNIKSRALANGDVSRAIDVLESMVLIAPDNIALLEELVMLEVQYDRPGNALERLADHWARGGIESEGLVALYSHLKGSLH